MAAPNETIEIDIRFEATKALITLSDLTNKTASFSKQVEYASGVVREFAKETGMNFDKAKSTLAGLDKEFSGTAASSTVFGAKGTEAWNKVGEAAETNSQKSVFATKAMGIALGMLIHQGINLVITAFQTMFTMAITGLRELETATYNLVNAERDLSQQGIDITPKGLDESIKNLQKIDPLLSKIQATEAVSRVSSLVAPAVGFNAKEIDQLTQSIAVLAVKNKGLGKSFEEVESQVSNAFLSGKVSVGINQLGVKITDQIVKDEALRMGLVKTADEYDKLTGKMQANVKARAMLSVITQSTSKDVAHLPEFFKTADAQFTIFQARLQDVFTQIGVAAAPVLIKVFETLIEGLQELSKWLDENKDAISAFMGVVAEAAPVFIKLTTAAIKFGVEFLSGITRVIGAIQKLINMFPFLKKAIESIAGKTTPDIGSAVDTPTTGSSLSSSTVASVNQDAKALAKAQDEITQAMKDDRDKRVDIERTYVNNIANIEKDAARKLEDIDISTRRKTIDAQAAYGDKVTSINADTTKAIADAKSEANKKEIDVQKKHQDDLKNLREKYLMDLEEALQNRDARQILKLMKQYALDKQKSQENFKVEQQQVRSEEAQKLADIEQARKDKLAAAKKDLEDKLKEIKLADTREREDAARAASRAIADEQRAHARQLEEQRMFLQRKLRDIADAIKKEYQLTAAGQAALNNLLYGSAGASSGNTASAYSPSSVNAGTYQAPTSSAGFSGYGSTFAAAGLYGTGGLAEGGSFLATRPSTLNIAETGPEMITATPLGKPGSDINKLFLQGGGGKGGGQLEIAMSLSPDLEAKIVKQSLDNVANVVMKINRSKI